MDEIKSLYLLKKQEMSSKNYYNTILSQVISPSGNYLVVGDIYGVVTVFKLHKIINPDNGNTKHDRKPSNSFVIQANIQINSLLATEEHLIVGSVGEIAGYTWINVVNAKDIKPSWKIEIPNPVDTFERVDVNCMTKSSEAGIIYAGCSDNSVHVININNGVIQGSLKGHTNYIHSVGVLGNELVSGGEDGLVNIWDIRTKKPVHKIEPYKQAKIQRPELGKWIGAVGISDDWLICGGGPRLSLWHYRSLNIATVFPLEDKGVHVATFYQDKILAGGRSKFFYQMNLNGDIVSEIPTSSVSIYSAVYQEEPYKALCLSGSSPNIDICSNFNYRDQVLTLN